MTRASSTILLAAIFAAGCAEMTWHKEGTEAAALAEDLDGCRQQARLRAYQEAWPFGLINNWRVVGMGAAGQPVVAYQNHFETDRFLLEHDLANFCMRGKGYDLVPVPKKTGER